MSPGGGIGALGTPPDELRSKFALLKARADRAEAKLAVAVDALEEAHKKRDFTAPEIAAHVVEDAIAEIRKMEAAGG